MYGERVHGVEYQDKHRKEVVALEVAPSHGSEAHGEADEHHGGADAVEDPGLVEELK